MPTQAVPQIDVRVEYDALRIFFGVMHLHLIRSKLLGVQAWMRAPEGKFVIEYTVDGGTVTCDYDSREKWEAILDDLAKVL